MDNTESGNTGYKTEQKQIKHIMTGNWVKSVMILFIYLHFIYKAYCPFNVECETCLINPIIQIQYVMSLISQDRHTLVDIGLLISHRILITIIFRVSIFDLDIEVHTYGRHYLLQMMYHLWRYQYSATLCISQTTMPCHECWTSHYYNDIGIIISQRENNAIKYTSNWLRLWSR